MSGYKSLSGAAHKKRKVLLILVAHTEPPLRRKVTARLRGDGSGESQTVVYFSVVALMCNPISDHRRVVVFDGRTSSCGGSDKYCVLMKRMMYRIGDGFVLEGPTTMVVNAKLDHMGEAAGGPITSVLSVYENCLNFIRQCVYYNGIDTSFVAELSSLLNDSCSTTNNNVGCYNSDADEDDNDNEEVWDVDNTPLPP